MTKIVDFGLSLVTQAGSAQAQEIFATPYYAPPEALEAKVEDFRSDIYALGASLYHALAGQPPITSTSTETKVLLTAKRQVKRLRKLAPHISPSTEALVAQMMAFDKESRCASYKEVTEGLQRALSGEAPSSNQVKGRRGGKKLSGLWMSLGLVGLILLGVGIFVVLRRGGDEPVVEETIPEPQLEDSGPSEAALIEKNYRRARNALQEGKLVEAEFNFLKLFQKEAVPEPTRSWAGLEAGLCALLDGRAGDTRLVFSKLKKRLPNAGLENETQQLLAGLLRDWEQLESLPIEQQCPSEPDAAMVEFAKALGNWEKGKRDSKDFFDSIVNQKFSDKQQWLASYQEWAGKLSNDLQLLDEEEPNWRKPWTPNEVGPELERLQALEAKLQTSGRALFTVASWREWLEGVQARAKKPAWKK